MNELRSRVIRTGPGREEVLAKNELPGQKQPRPITRVLAMAVADVHCTLGQQKGVQVHQGVGSTKEEGTTMTPSVP